MWVFTNKGFISIVQDKNNPSILMVRARDKKHLKTLFPKREPIFTPKADYAYRISATRSDVENLVMGLIEHLDYTNFKDSIPNTENDYHDACMGVWSEMHRFQHWGYRNKRIANTTRLVDHSPYDTDVEVRPLSSTGRPLKGCNPKIQEIKPEHKKPITKPVLDREVCVWCDHVAGTAPQGCCAPDGDGHLYKKIEKVR